MITVKDLQPHPLDQVHRLIEPGPVILVTTRHRGIPNVMTNGFNMMVRHDPPLIACTIGPWGHSYQALVETGECVISVPTADMAATVVDIGNCSGADVDKFEEFDLTAVSGAEVQAPLVAACFANIECRVADISLAAPYSLFLLEAVRAWTDPSQPQPQLFHHRGDGTFTLDGPTVDLKDRMTKWQYLVEASRASGALGQWQAKVKTGVTWAQLAEAVGKPLAWTTAALLELGDDAALAFQLQPPRGALDAAVPMDPTI